MRYYATNRYGTITYRETTDGARAVRIMPTANGVEWSVWSGPEGRRMLAAIGTCRTRSGARRAALRATGGTDA